MRLLSERFTAIYSLILMVLFTPLFATEPPKLPTLTESDQLIGNFIQKKKLATFPIELVSKGHFKLNLHEGVHWVTESPIASELKLNATALQSYSNERQVLSMDARTQPLVAMVAEIFTAALSGDWSALEAFFHTKTSVTPQGWHVEMTPRDKAAARIADAIHFDGEQFVKQITLYEPSGDQTRILFESIQLEPYRAPSRH